MFHNTAHWARHRLTTCIGGLWSTQRVNKGKLHILHMSGRSAVRVTGHNHSEKTVTLQRPWSSSGLASLWNSWMMMMMMMTCSATATSSRYVRINWQYEKKHTVMNHNCRLPRATEHVIQFRSYTHVCNEICANITESVQQINFAGILSAACRQCRTQCITLNNRTVICTFSITHFPAQYGQCQLVSTSLLAKHSTFSDTGKLFATITPIHFITFKFAEIWLLLIIVLIWKL